MTSVLYLRHRGGKFELEVIEAEWGMIVMIVHYCEDRGQVGGQQLGNLIEADSIVQWNGLMNVSVA